MVAAALLALNPEPAVSPGDADDRAAAAGGRVSRVVLWLYEWVRRWSRSTCPARLGWALFAAMWTRYEAWPVIAAAVAGCAVCIGAVGRRRPAPSMRVAARRLAGGGGRCCFSQQPDHGRRVVRHRRFLRAATRATTGRPSKSLIAVWWGTHQLSTRVDRDCRVAGAAALVVRALRRQGRRADSDSGRALRGRRCFPCYAFYQGHPFRIRYMVPLVAACALFSGLAVGLLRRPASMVLAGVLVGRRADPVAAVAARRADAGRGAVGSACRRGTAQR